MMRRKSERNKPKASPETKPEKPKRGRPSKRRKKSSSTSPDRDSADEEPVSPPQIETEPEPSVSHTTAKTAASPEKANFDNDGHEVWHVKASQSSDTGVQKLKICLSRPSSTPERPDRSPRGRRKLNRTSSQLDMESESGEEKRKTRHRSRRLSTKDGDAKEFKHDGEVIIEEQSDSEEARIGENDEKSDDARVENVQSGKVEREVKSPEQCRSTMHVDMPKAKETTPKIVIKLSDEKIPIMTSVILENKSRDVEDALKESPSKKKESPVIMQPVVDDASKDKAAKVVEASKSAAVIENKMEIQKEKSNTVTTSKDGESGVKDGLKVAAQSTEKFKTDSATVSSQSKVAADEKNTVDSVKETSQSMVVSESRIKDDSVKDSVKSKAVAEDKITVDVSSQSAAVTEVKIKVDSAKVSPQSTVVDEKAQTDSAKVEVKQTEVTKKVEVMKSVPDSTKELQMKQSIPDAVKKQEATQPKPDSTKEVEAKSSPEKQEKKPGESNMETVSDAPSSSDSKLSASQEKAQSSESRKDVRKPVEHIKESEKLQSVTKAETPKVAEKKRSISDSSSEAEPKIPAKEKSKDVDVSKESEVKKSAISQPSKEPERKLSSEMSREPERKKSIADRSDESESKKVIPELPKKVIPELPKVPERKKSVSEDSNKKRLSESVKTVQVAQVKSIEKDEVKDKSTSEVLQPVLEPNMAVPSRKRKWGSRTTKVGKSPILNISTDSLKNLIPDVEPVSVEEVLMEVKVKQPKEQRSPKKVVERNELNKTNGKYNVAEKVLEKEFSGAMSHRKISIVNEEAPKHQRPPSPAKHKSSCILHITNLVRPFTLPQLKNLLQRTGRIVENGFWIDKIKSRCYVQYSNEDEATETRHALHGVTWPVSNPKTLNVDFGSQAAMEEAMTAGDGDKPAGHVDTWVKEQARDGKTIHIEAGGDRGVGERRPVVREWDLGKGDSTREERGRDREREREGERRKRRSKSVSPSPAHKFKKKEEEAPAKLLDDLFKKTKTTPCIYWLPLNAETILIKEEQRRKHMAEHERRMEELRRAAEGEGGRGPPPHRHR